MSCSWRHRLALRVCHGSRGGRGEAGQSRSLAARRARGGGSPHGVSRCARRTAQVRTSGRLPIVPAGALPALPNGCDAATGQRVAPNRLMNDCDVPARQSARHERRQSRHRLEIIAGLEDAATRRPPQRDAPVCRTHAVRSTKRRISLDPTAPSPHRRSSSQPHGSSRAPENQCTSGKTCACPLQPPGVRQGDRQGRTATLGCAATS
jgi:hypothetical protein